MEKFFVSSELNGSENAIAARRMDWKKENPFFFPFFFFPLSCAVDQIWICVLCLDDHISITRIHITN